MRRPRVIQHLRRYFPQGFLQPLIGLASVLFFAAGIVLFFLFWAGKGEAQPIPFSHRFHVATKQLNCVLCHYQALSTANAGIPPVATCMLCHQKIIVAHPQIVRLTQYYNDGQPVPWVRVNNLREFVFFNHQRHIRAGFDCGRCHGDVAHMDRVVAPVNLNRMGFCVQCHRDENYSVDCFICHR